MGATNIIQLPCAGGLDQKTAQEYLDPGSRLVTVQNGNFVKVGAVDKRYGIKNLANTTVSGSGGTMLVGARAVGWSRSGLSLIVSKQSGSLTGGLYSYAFNSGGVASVAPLPACAVRRTPVTAPATAQPPVLCDFPVGTSTWRVAVYYDSAFDVYSTVQDLGTGDIVVGPTLLMTNTGNAAEVPLIKNVLYLPAAPAGQQVNIFIYDMASTHLKVATFAPSTLTFSAFTTILTAIGGFNVLTFTPDGKYGGCDVAPFVGDPSGGYLVIYGATDVTTKVAYFQGTTVQTTQTIETLGASNYMCCGMYVCGTWGELVWVLYTFVETGGPLYVCRMATFSGAAALTPQAAPSTPISGTAGPYTLSTLTRIDSTDVLVHYYSLANPGGGNGVNAPSGNWAQINNTLSVTATGSTPLGFLPAGRAFSIGSAFYQPGYLSLYNSNNPKPSSTHSQQYTLHLWQYTNVSSSPAADTVSLYPVATSAPRLVDESTFQLAALRVFEPGLVGCNFMSQSLADQTRYAIGLKLNSTEQAGSPAQLTAGQGGPAAQVDFLFDATSLAALYQASELGGALHIAGGVPFIADSATAAEAGFFYYPEFSYVVANSSSTTTQATGSYSYAVVYTYTDAAGLLHRSAPVFTGAISITNGGHGAQVHMPALSVTWRDRQVKGQVYAEIFRTTYTGGVAGSTFYFVDRIAVSGQAGTPTEILWPAGASACDNALDATINVASILYTTGGVLDHVNPPSAALLTTHQGRVALVDETLRAVWFSTQATPGEAPGFNEALVIPLQEGGDITAIASMDGNFVCFKQSSIWVMDGEGPAATGQGSSWSVPVRLPSDVGCIDWRSVVLTPLGLMFQAHNGIYLLGRDLRVTFIGKNVVDTLAASPTITSAVLVPDATQVRFTCSNGSATTTIAYDYLLDQWLTHTYPNLSAAVASACLDYTTNQYSFLTTDGKVWQERAPSDAALYLDTDSSGTAHFVPTTLTWAWVKPSGVQGYQRLRWAQLFAEQKETCGVTMTLATNYNATPVQTATWTATELAKLAIPGQVAMHASGPVGKQMAIQASVTDVAPASPTSGQGMRWVGLAFELDQIGQRYRQVPAGARR